VCALDEVIRLNAVYAHPAEVAARQYNDFNDKARRLVEQTYLDKYTTLSEISVLMDAKAIFESAKNIGVYACAVFLIPRGGLELRKS
jgi:hypothetical protein